MCSLRFRHESGLLQLTRVLSLPGSQLSLWQSRSLQPKTGTQQKPFFPEIPEKMKTHPMLQQQRFP